MGPIPPAAPLAGTDRSSRGASPHALSSCHLRSGVNGAETRRPHNPHRAQRPLRARSTKAGAETPATHLLGIKEAEIDLRSTKAGAETPATPTEVHRSPLLRSSAQRRPGPRPRRHAGSRPLASGRSALNEGRGRDPGDTH